VGRHVLPLCVCPARSARIPREIGITPELTPPPERPHLEATTFGRPPDLVSLTQGGGVGQDLIEVPAIGFAISQGM